MFLFFREYVSVFIIILNLNAYTVRGVTYKEYIKFTPVKVSRTIVELFLV